jgi:hypothetical protein
MLVNCTLFFSEILEGLKSHEYFKDGPLMEDVPNDTKKSYSRTKTEHLLQVKFTEDYIHEVCLDMALHMAEMGEL